MGQSRIEITATGNHGCDRDAKEGETLKRCDAKHCVDCRTLDFVDQLQRDGAITFNEGAIPPEGATLTHWPSNADGGIVDDLVTGKRKKNAFR